MQATPQALGLLLSLLEGKSLRYTHTALTDFHGKAGDELIASGLVAPLGFERVAVAADDDERPVSLHVDDRTHDLGYDSPSQGRIRVDQSTTAVYCARPDLLGRLLLDNRLYPPPLGSTRLDSGSFVWDLGSARLQGGRFAGCWFARRLGDRAVVEILRIENIARPPTNGRLVLTSTSRDRLANLSIAGSVIVSIADVLAGSQPTKIDIDMLTARFRGEPAEAIEFPLHLSADNRLMVINGSVRISFAGETQQRIARLIVDAHRAGQRVKAAEVLKKAGSGVSSFDQALSRQQWNALKGYFKSQGGGFWGFDF